jgi:hypothetical protein
VGKDLIGLAKYLQILRCREVAGSDQLAPFAPPDLDGAQTAHPVGLESIQVTQGWNIEAGVADSSQNRLPLFGFDLSSVNLHGDQRHVFKLLASLRFQQGPCRSVVGRNPSNMR